MKIKYVGRFVKHFKDRIEPHPNLVKRFIERVDLFTKSPDNPTLKEHELKGKKKGLRTFSITGDIRIIYFIRENDVYFIDIGTHNQVY